MFEVKILADSITEINGTDSRLLTVQLTFPRSILAEFNTHRVLSRNAASSRAIPSKRLIEKVNDVPFIPEFRLNKPGMQAAEHLAAKEAAQAKDLWLLAKNQMVNWVEALNSLNVHKQYVNRLIEPWMFCTVIATGTDWDNLFFQRCHEAAEPSFKKIAEMLREKVNQHKPERLNQDEWHLPLVKLGTKLPDWFELSNYLKELPENKQLTVPIDDQIDILYKLYPYQLISVGRCCKISYLNLDTGELDTLNDIRLGLFCLTNNPGHWSPSEHQATPAKTEDMIYKIDQLYQFPLKPKPNAVGYCGPLKGWKQFRKCFGNENYAEEDVDVS